MLALLSSCTREYHVSVTGDDQGTGTRSDPFRTISRAAEAAMPGDVVIVHGGIYRERVNPPRGGSSDRKRITYRVAEGETAEIRGSEIISGWDSLGAGIWMAVIPDTLFDAHNPFAVNIAGDWLVDGQWNHTGEVYLDGRSLYEARGLAGVWNPVPHERTLDQEAACRTWFAEVGEKETRVWANFGDADPNERLVEVNVREACFYPDMPGRDYITVDGFHMSQAATQWAPPSAEQVGMVGTHWSRGWVIRNCTLHDSKCSALTLGKDRKSGHNGWEPGTSGAEHYTRIVRRALEGSGWSGEYIGGHLVENNHIYNCEQTGICGSLGPVFSRVSGNHIHHIWTKRQFFGYEIGAIKFHAPVDVLISGNRLHDAHKGMWMDWMTQGTRISGNLCYNNEMADLFSEVNHGPYLVDNNIFLSGIANWSEGGAFVHNLVAGPVDLQQVTDRSTPILEPHGTKIIGMSHTTLGDDRFYNNIFTGPLLPAPAEVEPMDPASPVNTNRHSPCGLEAYNRGQVEFPVYAVSNVYLGPALPLETEKGALVLPSNGADLYLEEREDGIYLHINLDVDLAAMTNPTVTTELLGVSFRSGQAWEDPDGSPLKIDRDYFGKSRHRSHPTPGPFENLRRGGVFLKVW
jgi:hypothetical protein